MANTLDPMDLKQIIPQLPRVSPSVVLLNGTAQLPPSITSSGIPFFHNPLHY